MANVTDSLIQETYDVKQQLGDLPSVVQSLQKFSSKIQLKQHSHQIKELTYNTTNNVMIWGHPTLGLWGDNWGTTATAFDQTDYAIIPNNNEFIEYFFNTTYIDLVNSDNIGDGLLSFVDLSIPLTTVLEFGTEGLTLQSTIIAKLRSPINSVTPIVDCTGDFTIYVSNDSGVNYHIATNNTKYTFSTSSDSDELLYAIVSNEPITINKITIKINK